MVEENTNQATPAVPETPAQPDLTGAPSVVCNCGSDIWRQGVVVKQVTAENGDKSLHTVPVLTCIVCNKPLVIQPAEEEKTEDTPAEEAVAPAAPKPAATQTTVME